MPNGELVREVEKEQLCGCCWCCVYGTPYYVEKNGIVLNKNTKLSVCRKGLQGEHTIAINRVKDCTMWKVDAEKVKKAEYFLDSTEEL